MNALLAAYPDLARRLQFPEGQCPAMVRTYRGSTWRCNRRAGWQVQGHPPECGQHAAKTLRKHLQDLTDAAGGS